MFSYEKDRISLTDPELYQYLEKEKDRQEFSLELIASENYASPAVMEAQGSLLTNKYAEGYPGKRYYGGCENVDFIENLAIDRVKKLFNAEYANVQPHSGSQANMAVYLSVLNPGDKIMGMDLNHGGHLTHGSPVNFSGKLFQSVFYGLSSDTETLDFNVIEDLIKKERPKLVIAGASAYPRTIDFKKFKELTDRYDCYLLADIAHIAGLVATGLHPSPIGYADFTTSTTHKTLRGPRGGVILSDKKWEKKCNSNIFPGIQGGPLEHIIAAKAVAFKEALSPQFKVYQQQVLTNAKVLAQTLQEGGADLVSQGTENHLILLKTDSFNLSGKEAEHLLESIGVTCNKNMVPGDKRSPFVTSGLRLGTPAMTTRGLSESHMEIIGKTIIKALKNPTHNQVLTNLKKEIESLCREFPVYS